MRRIGMVVLIAVMILSLTVVGASAEASGPPASNLACDSSGCYATLHAYSSCFGTCTPKKVVYLKWDFNVNPPASSAPITTARLTLTTSLVQLSLYPSISFQLWPANYFDEATTSNPGYTNTSPPLGTATLTLDNGDAPQPVVFDAGNSPGLASYLENARNDSGRTGPGYASLAVIISSGTFVPEVTFANRTSGTPPYLDLRNATAVTLSTFGSADAPSNWWLIAGLAGLAVFTVAGGVRIYRKRAAVRA